MKPLRSFAWYAKEIKPFIPDQAFKPSATKLIGGLSFLLIVVSCSWIIIQYRPMFIISLSLSFIIGICFSGMIILSHELMHGTIVRKKWMQHFFGAILFWPISISPVFWIRWHNLSHHVHTQDHKHDPDIKYVFASKGIWRGIPFFIHALYKLTILCISSSLYAHIVLFNHLKELPFKKRTIILISSFLPTISWILLLVLIGFKSWLFVYLLPLFVANYILGLYLNTQHYLNPETKVNDPLANTLTINVPRWVNWIHFNFSYHTEHHIFPGMNSKYYPLVKKQLKEKFPDLYQEMSVVEALKLWFRTRKNEFNYTKLRDSYQITGSEKEYRGIKETFKERERNKSR
ncbi:acyl-CoA desaturase [Bacillus carboniphilus]|uniref:Acyl-CoA desaturase n=1 Tax=Bacillus carboniphilus TaxID=86663 RepID=A0ABY9JTH8_9BACI|nr:acyl-CoA desaturase [Bacillus carboniphilus]WLR42685.1 acyl-CoA desaturase [Bacillus carboniphilus]